MSPISRDETSLKKLTIPDLKKLCKEASLAGYSKLNKPALISRLLSVTSSSASLHFSVSSAATHVVPQIAKPQDHVSPVSDKVELLNGNSKRIEADFTEPLKNAKQPKLCHPNPTNSQVGAGTSRPHIPSATTTFRRIISSSPTLTPSQSVRDANTTSATVVSTEKPPREPMLPPTPMSDHAVLGLPPKPECSLTRCASSELMVALLPKKQQTIKTPNLIDSHAPSAKNLTMKQTAHISTTGKGKRFAPLKPSKKSSGVPHATASALLPPADSANSPDPPAPISDYVYSPPNLSPIKFPPSRSQRRTGEMFAIVLSQVTEPSDLTNCAFVSRAFRYGVYLSAVHRLRWILPSKEFERMIKKYPQHSTNFWPYLRYKQNEAKEKFSASIWGTFFAGKCLMSSSIWISAGKPLLVAIRFWITRAFFAVSVGEQNLNWKDDIVVDVKEIVPNQIWRLVMRSHESGIHTVYVLEETCEIIGRSESTTSLGIRSDWFSYIQQKYHFPNGLLDLLSWAHHEEYHLGISRLWSKREGQPGNEKMKIAKRYILACVVANGVSGEWQTSVAMAQEMAGLSSNCAPVSKSKSQKIQMYLPEHHHVESVHFTTSLSKLPLHPAIAIVQTMSGREYFILRENGMQIGSSESAEEGVAEVWQKVLGCSVDGQAL